MKLLGVSGSLLGSKTPAAINVVLQRAKIKYPEIETELLDLRDYKNIEFCDGRPLDKYNEHTNTVIEKILSADCYVIGSPIYQSSITGVLKNIFDLLPVQSFQHKVMGFVATGGTYQHYLVIENQLKPIAGFFRAYIAPSYVYLNKDHFGIDQTVENEEVLVRLEKLAEEIIFMHTKLIEN